jgi:hypothetical protein
LGERYAKAGTLAQSGRGRNDRRRPRYAPVARFDDHSKPQPSLSLLSGAPRNEAISGVLRFAADSSPEEDGFEPSVPGDKRGSRHRKWRDFCKCPPAGYPAVRRCGDVRLCALVKGSMAWLLCLPVGQASALASSYSSTLFFAQSALTRYLNFPLPTIIETFLLVAASVCRQYREGKSPQPS